MAIFTVKEDTAPSNPPSGYIRLYASSNDNKLHILDSVGNDANLFTTAGSQTIQGDFTVDSSYQLFLPDGTASDPSLAFTNDTDTGIFHSSNGVLDITSGGSTVLSVNTSSLTVQSSQIRSGDGSTAAPTYSFSSAVDAGLYNKGSNQLGVSVQGNDSVVFANEASGVNYLELSGSATGNDVSLKSLGSDTNVNLALTPKGSGNLVLDGVSWPNSDGSSGQILETNGSGSLSWRYEPYVLSFFKPGTLSDGETVLINVTAQDFFYPSGFTGSQGYAATAPADGSKSFDVQKNGASIGSVDFAQGANTPTFTLSSQTSFTAGDRITIVAPATADSAMADVTITLAGNRT